MRSLLNICQLKIKICVRPSPPAYLDGNLFSRQAETNFRFGVWVHPAIFNKTCYMKNLTVILLLLAFYAAGAQGSKVYDDLSLKSKILGMDKKYAVYLPPGYETSQR